MHDREIEDRLRTALRAEGDALPLTITTAELERRLASRRRARSGGRLRLIAAGVAVVAVGSLAVMAVGWLRPPAVGSLPELSPSHGASAAVSPSPTATLPASLVPGCEPIDPTRSATPPSIAAGVIPGDSIAYEGHTGAYAWGGDTVGVPGSWDEPDAVEQFSLGPDPGAIELVSDACLASVEAEALMIHTREPDPQPVTLDVLRGAGGRVVDIAPPGVGIHLVRVRASFTTTDASPAWSETTFQVVVVFDAPELTMALPGAGDGPTADPNCASYDLASGAQAADQCGGPYEVVTDLSPLVVASGSPVQFRLTDGWQIDGGRVTAVQTDLVRAGTFAPEYSVDFLETGGPTVSVPVVLDPGEWIVRFSLNGSRGEDSFGAWYDFPLVVAE